MSAQQQAVWKGNRLYLGNRLSGYRIVLAAYTREAEMWRVRRPDDSLSDMVNRTRAKDAAVVMLDRFLSSSPRVSGEAHAA
jgi:hypothetical protein